MAKTSTKIIVGLTSMACFAGFAAYTNHYDTAKNESTPVKAAVQPQAAKEILLATAPVVTDVTAKPAAPAAISDPAGRTPATQVYAPAASVAVQADAAVNTPPDSAPAPEPAPAKKKNTKTRAS